MASTRILYRRPAILLPSIVAVLGLLVLVLELAAEDRACYGSNNAVAAHLVTAEVTSCTAT